MKRPFTVFILILIMLFQCISAFYGGIIFLADPTGSLMQLSGDYIKGSVFENYLIPGIVLITLLGITPLIAMVSLFGKKESVFFNRINIYKDMHWGWTYSLYTGIMLNIWITVQIMIIGYHHMIQTVYGFFGTIIIISVLLPANIKYYKKNYE